MSVIKCHQQFRAAAKCTGSPMQACLREGWKCILGWTGRPVSRGQKQQSCGKSAKPTGLRPEPGTYGESSSKMHWKPDAGLPARELEVHFGMDGTSISRGQKQQSCGKSAKPTGLRP